MRGWVRMLACNLRRYPQAHAAGCRRRARNMAELCLRNVRVGMQLRGTCGHALPSCTAACLLQAATASKDAEDTSVAQLAADRQAALAAADRNAAEVKRLRAELAHLQRMMQDEGTMRLAGSAAGLRASIADISDAQVGLGRQL